MGQDQEWGEVGPGNRWPVSPGELEFRLKDDGKHHRVFGVEWQNLAHILRGSLLVGWEEAWRGPREEMGDRCALCVHVPVSRLSFGAQTVPACGTSL